VAGVNNGDGHEDEAVCLTAGLAGLVYHDCNAPVRTFGACVCAAGRCVRAGCVAVQPSAAAWQPLQQRLAHGPSVLVRAEAVAGRPPEIAVIFLTLSVVRLAARSFCSDAPSAVSRAGASSQVCAQK